MRIIEGWFNSRIQTMSFAVLTILSYLIKPTKKGKNVTMAIFVAMILKKVSTLCKCKPKTLLYCILTRHTSMPHSHQPEHRIT